MQITIKEWSPIGFCLGIMMLVATVASGQSGPGKLSWSPAYKMPANPEAVQVIGLTGNEVFLFRKKAITAFTTKTKIYLERYDRNGMELKNAQEIVLRRNRQDLNFEKVLYLKGKIWLFTSFNNQAQERNYLFKQEVSTRSLNPSPRMQKLVEGPAYRDDPMNRTFDFQLSQDSSTLLIYNQYPTKRKTPEQFGLQVFDADLNPLWSKKVTLPYDDSRFAIEEYRIDNDGNVYMLGVKFQDDVQRRREGQPDYQYVILAYRKQGDEFIELEVDLRDKFITDLTFRVDKKRHLVCSGFYSEKNSYSVRGTYFFRVNTDTREIYYRNLKPFDFDFVTEYMSERRKEWARRAEEEGNVRKTAELYRYDLADLILRTDGGALLVAEQYFVQRDFYRNWDGTFREVYTYNYNDIIVVNIQPNGEIEWATRIPKQQQTVNDGGYYSSFAMSTVRDRLFFVFNDNSRNFNPRNNRQYVYAGAGSVLTLAEVRIDGSLTKHPLTLSGDLGVTPRPKVCRQIGSREMLIYAESGKNYRLGKLRFQL